MTVQRDTQIRFNSTPLDIIGYNAYLNDAAGTTIATHLTGWSVGDIGDMQYLNAKDPGGDPNGGNGDPATGASCLFLNDTDVSSSLPKMDQTISQEFIGHLFTNGGEVIMVNKPEDADRTTFANGSCSWAWGWNVGDDPRVPDVYHFNNAQSYALLTGSKPSGAFDVQAGGSIEFELWGYTGSGASYWIFGHDIENKADMDGIYIANNVSVVVRVNGVAYEDANWRNRLHTDGRKNTIKLERHATNEQWLCWINGTAYGYTSGTSTPAQCNVNTLFYAADGHTDARPWAVTNIKIKETATSHEYHFECLDRSGVWVDVNGTDEKFELNQAGNLDTLWFKNGVKGRMLIGAGKDATNYNWAVYNSSAASADARISKTIDNMFHDIRVLINPSPDGLNWGSAAISDGVNVSPYINDWVRTDSNSASIWGVQSGATTNNGTGNRLSKHVAMQLQAYQDRRDYPLIDQAFDFNGISGAIGLRDIDIDLTALADSSAACSIFEIDLLSSTRITLDSATATIDGSTAPVIINPNNTETVRRVYIIKDSDGAEFVTTQLNGGG